MNIDSKKRAELLDKIDSFRKQLEELKSRADDPVARKPHDVFFNSLLEHIPDSIYFKDTNSKFLLVNNAHARLLGIQKTQDAHGKTDFDFFDTVYAQNAYADEQYIIRSGKPIVNKREKLVLPDARTRWVSVTKAPLRDGNGRIFGIVGISRDITDEKRQEEKLGDSEHRFRRLLTDASDVISILDRKGVVLYESPSAVRVFGSGETRKRTGSNFFAFCHPEDLKQVIYTFSELIQKPRESRKIEFRFRHADGSWILIESICRNMLDDPAINGILVSSRNITEGKRLADRTKIFEDVIKTANDAIVIADLNNYIIFVNQAFCETYDYSAEEVIGKHLDLILSSKNANELFGSVVRESERTGWEGEVYNRKKNGIDFPVHLSTSLIKDESGNPIAVAGIIRDITRQKQLEEQLRQSQKMESLSVLVGGIAHNFNNIFGIIMGYASFLEDPRVEREKVNQSVQVINEAVERGANLVNQLMMYIRKSPVKFEDVAIYEIITEMIEMVTQTFPPTIQISVDLEQGNPTVHADRNQIRQVLFNLLLNARDAMPNGGTITVTTNIVDGASLTKEFIHAEKIRYVHIAVHDTGVGMDEEVRSRIFDPFFTTKEVGQGVGLGLPMVYGIVENHGGFINVESTVDEGSTFSVYMPLLRLDEANNQEEVEKHQTLQKVQGKQEVPQKQKEEKERRTEAFHKQAATGESILVVEDEDSIRTLLVDLLKNVGYTVYQAADGLEALKEFEKQQQNLHAVILDIGLPTLGGYEVFLKMREINPEIPVIIASGYNDPDAKLAIESAGARLFIQKPYRYDHILKVVRDVINTQKGDQ